MDPAAALGLNRCKSVDVPGVQHDRLLADCLRAVAQRHTDVRVVKVVWGADRDKVNGLAGPIQLVEVAVEPLRLSEKVCFREERVNDSDTVLRIKYGNKRVASLLDRLHVTRRDEARGSDDAES